ncbi:MAG: hypothetical protein GY756_25685 [bacterium]|nr:hypothetical protein [bacterium]
MFKKIKKWHILVLIIVALGGYWLTQNMWVFEKKIAVEDYQSFLSDTVWKWDYLGTKWVFESDGTYSEYIINEDDIDKVFFKGTWEINENELTTNGIRYIEGRGNSEFGIEKIKIITNKHLIADPYLPSTGGMGITYKLKRIDFE